MEEFFKIYICINMFKILLLLKSWDWSLQRLFFSFILILNNENIFTFETGFESAVCMFFYLFICIKDSVLLCLHGL